MHDHFTAATEQPPMPTRNSVICFSQAAFLLIASLLFSLHCAVAQHNATAVDRSSADEKIVTTTTPTASQDQTAQQGPRDRTRNTVAQNNKEAWSMLTEAAEDEKHADVRIQALAALGKLGADSRGEKMIVAAMKAPDDEVSTAAVLAEGQTKSRNL